MSEIAKIDLPVVSKEALGKVSDDSMEQMIPKPVGYHLLIAMPEIEETFGDSGIVKAAKTVQHDTLLSMIGLVLDMGGQAYADKDRFPTGPWCEVGQYVMFRMNSGTRFKVGRQEYRLLNDDSIEAVVNDPRGVTRV